MTPQDAARIMSSLHGAFPYATVDDDVVQAWSNTLDLVDFAIAEAAVERWVGAETFWPSIAAFNGLATEIRREQRGEQPQPERALSAIRCDSSGWFDRGEGKEPCPTCNPWVRERWDRGVFEQRMKPPRDYVMPQPCRPTHAGEGPMVLNHHRAMQLVLAGLREQLAENGLTPEQIDETVARRMPTVLAAVGAVPEGTSPYDDG